LQQAAGNSVCRAFMSCCQDYSDTAEVKAVCCVTASWWHFVYIGHVCKICPTNLPLVYLRTATRQQLCREEVHSSWKQNTHTWWWSVPEAIPVFRVLSPALLGQLLVGQRAGIIELGP